jgi:hypothetical protein
MNSRFVPLCESEKRRKINEMAYCCNCHCGVVPGIILRLFGSKQSDPGARQGSGSKDYRTQSNGEAACRLDTLNGKTVYLVNDGYLSTDILLDEMLAWFKANMPQVNAVYKVKGGGGFTAEDPALWAEIKEKADAVVMGMGH